MTVTYRRIRPRRTDPAAVPGRAGARPITTDEPQPLQPRLRTCRSCRTSIGVRTDRRNTVVIQIRGATCSACNSNRQPPPDPPTGRVRTTIVPDQPSGGPARLLTMSEDEADRSAVFLPERVVAVPARAQAEPEAAARTNVAWRQAVEPIASLVLSPPEVPMLRQAWQPEHCEVLEAVAQAVDEVWARVVPASLETTIVLSTASLSPVAAAIILDLAERSASTVEEPPALLGEVLRFTGVALCAATDHAISCGRIRHELEGVPEVPDQPWVHQVETRLRRALPAAPAITLSEFLREWQIPVEYAQSGLTFVAVDTPEPTLATGPLEQTRAATAARLDGPAQVSTFGPQ